jgi:hypothetical protein
MNFITLAGMLPLDRISKRSDDDVKKNLGKHFFFSSMNLLRAFSQTCN